MSTSHNTALPHSNSYASFASTHLQISIGHMTDFAGARCVIQAKDIASGPSESPVAGDHHQIPPDKGGGYHWSKGKRGGLKHEDVDNIQLAMQTSSGA